MDGLEKGRSLAVALRARGVGRVSDSLILPLSQGLGPSYAATCVVRFHEHDELMWLRAADVPFDFLPATMRPLTEPRAGAFFTLGPGITRDGSEHPAVLHVQVEGPPLTVSEIVAGLRPLLQELADLREVRVSTHAGRWHRHCFAAVSQL